MRTAVILIFFWLLFACYGLYAQSIQWPAVPVPDGAVGSRISDHMLYNGLDMRASRFTTKLKPDEVVHFYREKWAPSIVVTPVHGGQVIGRVENGFSITVEVKSGGQGALAQIGILRMPSGPPIKALGAGVLLPSGSSVYEDISYPGEVGAPRTVSAGNSLSPMQNTQQVISAYRRVGYQLDSSGHSCVPASSYCSVVLSRRGQRVSFTAFRVPRPLPASHGRASTALMFVSTEITQ